MKYNGSWRLDNAKLIGRDELTIYLISAWESYSVSDWDSDPDVLSNSVLVLSAEFDSVSDWYLDSFSKWDS